MQILQWNETLRMCLRVCLDARACFSLGVWEPPKVGTGQPSHPCPVFLPEREGKKNERWGGCEQDAAIANTQEQIWGFWGMGGAKIPRRGWVGAVVTSLRSQTARSGFSMQTHKHSHGVHTQTPKQREGRLKRCAKQQSKTWKEKKKMSRFCHNPQHGASPGKILTRWLREKKKGFSRRMGTRKAKPLVLENYLWFFFFFILKDDKIQWGWGNSPGFHAGFPPIIKSTSSTQNLLHATCRDV